MVGIVIWGAYVGRLELDAEKIKKRWERLNGKEGTYFFLVPAEGVPRQKMINHLYDIQPFIKWRWRFIRNCLVPIIRWHEFVDVSLNRPAIHPDYHSTIIAITS
jgi:hypothetical protein